MNEDKNKKPLEGGEIKPATSEKKVPIIIELGDSNLDEIAGGNAYRCDPGYNRRQ